MLLKSKSLQQITVLSEPQWVLHKLLDLLVLVQDMVRYAVLRASLAGSSCLEDSLQHAEETRGTMLHLSAHLLALFLSRPHMLSSVSKPMLLRTSTYQAHLIASTQPTLPSSDLLFQLTALLKEVRGSNSTAIFKLQQLLLATRIFTWSLQAKSSIAMQTGIQ
jgi:hypothetical protein